MNTFNAFDAMMAVSRIEDKILELKRIACNGSMLEGHTIKPAAEIDHGAALDVLDDMEKEIITARRHFTDV